MPREWNPDWKEPAELDNDEYKGCLHRAMMASVNWIENHPEENPHWKSLNVNEIVERAGALHRVPSEEILVVAPWNVAYVAQDDSSRSWFKAIVDAASGGVDDNEPSSIIMDKAVAAGILMGKIGWDKFDRFMSDPDNFLKEHRE